MRKARKECKDREDRKEYKDREESKDHQERTARTVNLRRLHFVPGRTQPIALVRNVIMQITVVIRGATETTSSWSVSQTERGARGTLVATVSVQVAAVNNELSGGAACTTSCGGEDKVYASAVGGCMVTSDTGTCQQGFSARAGGLSCVCEPR